MFVKLDEKKRVEERSTKALAERLGILSKMGKGDEG